MPKYKLSAITTIQKSLFYSRILQVITKKQFFSLQTIRYVIIVYFTITLKCKEKVHSISTPTQQSKYQQQNLSSSTFADSFLVSIK